MIGAKVCGKHNCGPCLELLSLERLKTLRVRYVCVLALSLPSPMSNNGPYIRRGVADKYMGTVPVEHLTATWTYVMNFAYGEGAVLTAIPLYLFPDETLTPSVTLLINLFGQVRGAWVSLSPSLLLLVLLLVLAFLSALLSAFVGGVMKLSR